ncbi:MAG: hypothetical protein KDC73_05120 [Ignavibacteriae bacterium]|nr:hypothetical protein [Ignavibacteriota bacterium]MCB9243896.1 hypothetical protein [Ignavibacteriales bacterium]
MNFNLKKYTDGTYSRMMVYLIGVLSVLLIMGFLLSGCNLENVAGGQNENENENDNVSVAMKVSQSDNPSNTLSLSEAKFLITEVYFRRPDNTEGEVRIAPVVVYLDLTGRVTVATSGSIPAGTYNRLRFKVHKVEDFETVPDPDFKEGTSGSKRYSVIAKGSFNGSSFVYKSRKSINMEMTFSNPVTISAGQKVNMTISLNPYSWFFANGDYINPSSSSNENTIDDNIKSAFRHIFIDNDLNGQP